MLDEEACAYVFGRNKQRIHFRTENIQQPVNPSNPEIKKVPILGVERHQIKKPKLRLHIYFISVHPGDQVAFNDAAIGMHIKEQPMRKQS